MKTISNPKMEEATNRMRALRADPERNKMSAVGFFLLLCGVGFCAAPWIPLWAGFALIAVALHLISKRWTKATGTWLIGFIEGLAGAIAKLRTAIMKGNGKP